MTVRKDYESGQYVKLVVTDVKYIDNKVYFIGNVIEHSNQLWDGVDDDYTILMDENVSVLEV